MDEETRIYVIVNLVLAVVTLIAAGLLLLLTW